MHFSLYSIQAHLGVKNSSLFVNFEKGTPFCKLVTYNFMGMFVRIDFSHIYTSFH